MRLFLLSVVISLGLTSCDPWKSSSHEVDEEIRKANREFYVSVFENGADSGPERLKRHEKLLAAAEKATGKDGAIFRISLKTFGEILPDFIRAEEMEDHLLDMLDLESLHRRKDYGERRQFFQDFRKVTREVNVFLQNTMQERIKQRLDEAGINGPDRESLETQYINSMHENGKEWLIMRQTNFEISGLMLEMNDLLESKDGQWRLNEKGKVLLDDQSAQQVFQELSQKLRAAWGKHGEASNRELKAWTQ